MKKALLIALLVGAISVFVVQNRQDPDAVPTTTEVSARIMSPFCPGVTLHECTSNQAAELRSKIQLQVKAGATNDEIDRWLTDNYGEAVLARPKSPWVWAPPAAGVLGAAAFLTRRLKGSRPAGPEVAELSEHEKSRLEDDLQRFAQGRIR